MAYKSKENLRGVKMDIVLKLEKPEIGETYIAYDRVRKEKLGFKLVYVEPIKKEGKGKRREMGSLSDVVRGRFKDKNFKPLTREQAHER